MLARHPVDNTMMSAVPSCASTEASVLVVDDDDAMVGLMRRLVERMGHCCEIAVSGERAIDLLASTPFDLIVTDINMGAMSGLEVLNEAKRANADVAVVIVSGVNDAQVADMALAKGAFGYVVKPFDVTEFQIAVSNALRRRELEQQVRSHLHDLEVKVERRTDELRHASEDLRVREQRFRSLAHASPLGILYADAHGRVEYCNAGAEAVLGRTLVQLGARCWIESLAASDREQVETAVRSVLADGGDVTVEFQLDAPDGATRWVRSPIAAVVDDEARPTGVVVVLEDISDRVRLEAELRRRATRDPLTGLVNRAEFRSRLECRLEQLGDDEVLAVLLIDLDQFKLVNDSFGHEVGDQLIVSVAERLVATLPENALVARLGGDEFVVAIVRHDGGHVDVAERLRVALRERISLSNVELSLSASVGLVTTSDATASVSDLLRAADIAMHDAKASRDAVRVFDGSMSAGVARRLVLTTELRRAVDEERVSVHFQPIIDLRSREIVGFEALARWAHPELGAISPAEFIPLAESTGLVQAIDRQVFQCAIAQLARWRAEGRVSREVFMSVNLSPSQLTNAALPELVAATLGSAGIEGSALCIEVTESTLIADLARATPILDELRRLGVRIAVDDFGTGHSALSYLGQLPLDVLKIDRSFVAELGNGTPDVIDILIELAHRLDLRVVAEGVEQMGQLARLTDLGCDMAQGFLIARPGSPDTVVSALPAPTRMAAGPNDARLLTPPPIPALEEVTA